MYEINWGGEYCICESGNPYKPCIELVKQKAQNGLPIPTDKFIVKTLHTDHYDEIEIAVQTIIALLHLNNHYGFEDEL